MVEAYKKLERSVVESSFAVENAFVGAYQKIEDKFVDTFLEEVTEDFGDTLYDLGRGFRDFAIWFLGSSPVIVLWVLIIAVIVVIFRTIGKKKRFKKTLKTTNPEESGDIKE